MHHDEEFGSLLFVVVVIPVLETNNSLGDSTPKLAEWSITSLTMDKLTGDQLSDGRPWPSIGRCAQNYYTQTGGVFVLVLSDAVTNREPTK